MIDRNEIIEVLQEYDPTDFKIGAVASHSALDVFDGAVEEGFQTYAICRSGREQTYTKMNFSCLQNSNHSSTITYFSYLTAPLHPTAV